MIPLNLLFLLTGIIIGQAQESITSQSPFETLLRLPIESRVPQFQKRRAESFPFLSRAAFDKSKSLQVRWRAITTMGRVDPEFFRVNLDRALVSPEWFMRNAALIALQTDDRTRAVQMSARLLTDSALVVRTQAVRNLLQLEARESEGLLWQQIFAARNFHGKESLWVRSHLAEALAHFASPGRVKSFQRLLMDRDERLHKWAVLGLENATGFKTSDAKVPLEIRRQQWLERLGVAEI